MELKNGPGKKNEKQLRIWNMEYGKVITNEAQRKVATDFRAHTRSVGRVRRHKDTD